MTERSLALPDSNELRGSILPLENGDHLSRAEFERRYEAMTELKKAELLDGVVYIMGSPVSPRNHAIPHVDASHWLATYRWSTPGTEVSDNGTVRFDDRNEPQPDLAMMVLPEFGGRVQIPEHYIEGAPDLIFEIASSSVSLDLHKKLRIYQQHGVAEYLVWRVRQESIDWLVLRNGQYLALKPNDDGVLRSERFPGLWLHVQAMVRRDMVNVLQILQQGIATPEHAAFVERLRAEAARIAQAKSPS